VVSRPKVFCIGAHKTGTTSMGQALATLGFSVFPESHWYADLPLRDDFYAGRYTRLAELIGSHDAFEDSPFNHGDFYKWLHGAYPGARFILTVRDTDGLIASHRRWLKHLRRLVFPQNREVEAFVRFFWQHEYRQGDFIDNEAAIREIYEARNRSAIEFFSDKPGTLLTLDLEQHAAPWDPLCAFLNVEVPSAAFPHLTRTK
jgi:hypothetical protein